MSSEVKETVRPESAIASRLDEQRALGARAFHPSGAVAPFDTADVEQSIARRFEQQVASYPAKIAIVPAPGIGPAGQWTYRALNEQANRLARTILAHLGEGPDGSGGPEPVALLLENQTSTIVAMLAVLKAGKFYVSLDPEYPIGRLQMMMSDSGARLVVTDGRNRALAVELAGAEEGGTGTEDPGPRVLGSMVIGIDLDLVNAPDSALDDNLDLDVAPDALAYIIYTSGSTGEPKGIVYDQRSVLAGIRNYTNAFHISPHDKLTLLHSMSFSSAMVDIYCALLNGATLYPWHVKTDGLAGLEDWLAREEVTICDWVPSPFRYFVDALTGNTNLPHLRLLVLASEPVTRRDVELYRAHLSRNCILVNRLGATETYNYRLYFVGYVPGYGESDPWYGGIEGDLVPAGYAVPDKVVELRDPERGSLAAGSSSAREVPPGEVGEITVRSPYLARGYWRRPELTGQKFQPAGQGDGAPGFRGQDGPPVTVYWTGDLGVMHADGLLEFRGRKDFQVKIRGFRIEPAEIEAALRRLPGIRDAAVMAWDGRPEADGESRRPGGGPQEASPQGVGRERATPEATRLVAYVVPANHSLPTAPALRSMLLGSLPDYMVPSIYLTLDALPLTPSGKLDRRALPPPRPSSDRGERASYVAPHDDLERGLVKMWRRILGVERVGIKDNFFELGGHSMAAVRVLVAIERELGMKVTPATFYRHPTIEQMADVLRDGGTERGRPGSPLVVMRAPSTVDHAAGTVEAEAGPLFPSRPAPGAAETPRPPFFALPGNLGNVHTDLGDLAEFLGPDQPFYGLQDGPKIPARIPEMAELYVDEIRQLQPQGPYFLGGVCLGAVVAYEMAQRLQEQGQEVALLAMIEPARPWRRSPRAPLGPEAYVSFVRFVLTKALKRLGRSGATSPSEREQQAGGSRQATKSGEGSRSLVESVRVGLVWLRMKLKLVANVWALRHYAPKPYPGNVQIFMSEGSLATARLSARHDQPKGIGGSQLDWLHLIGAETPIHDIPGNHDSITGDNRVIIEPAHMQVLAHKLRRSIDQAYGQHKHNSLRLREKTTIERNDEQWSALI